MFIRIGIGKFIMDFGDHRLEKDRRKGGDRRARHFIMDDEDRRAEEKRRKLDRRGCEPFPENSSSDNQAGDKANNENKTDEQASRAKREKAPRKWQK
ncbi:MAG: hypothetical protein KAR83_06050 [Thermodesulfovibrionales bacterium]|nr:hypothetical protein [Thermodesulfovibrionales bacterium]